jgi:hypothetical protein
MRPPTIAERRFAEVRERLRGLPDREIFNFIYHNNLWGSPESHSGLGSQLDATARVRTELPLLLERIGANSLLDVPCGDFSWLSTTQLPIERYIGGDIVPDIVAKNEARFRGTHPFAQFRVLDVTCDALPAADALMCRDCLVHLPYASIFSALRNMSRSPIQHLILTTFAGERENRDIEPGDWRPLNLQEPPFSLPPPEILLLEGCTEEDGAYADKALGVWSIAQLRTLRPLPEA